MPTGAAHNRAIAIYRSPEAAQEAIAASPIHFTLGGDIEEFEKHWDDVDKQIQRQISNHTSATQPTFEVERESERRSDREREMGTEADGQPAWMDQERDSQAEIEADIDEAQNLVPPGDPEVALGNRDGAVIQPPWQAEAARESARHATTDSSKVETVLPSSAAAPMADDPMMDPANPISLPKLPDKPPVIAQAPVYRHSNLSGIARRTVASPAPTYDDDPVAHPKARPAVLEIAMSGLAHQFYNERQPYSGSYPLKGTSYPGDGVLGDFPPGLHGLADSNLTRPELAVRQRERREEQRLKMDVFQGRSLRQLWMEGDRDRLKRFRRGESEKEWVETMLNIEARPR